MPGRRSRHTATEKQKPANSTSSVALNRMAHSGSTLPSEVLAPTPATSENSPVRTQAA